MVHGQRSPQLNSFIEYRNFTEVNIYIKTKFNNIYKIMIIFTHHLAIVALKF